MSAKYQEYKGLNLPESAKKVAEKWKQENVFQASIDSKSDEKSFVFFEGPPSANGLPGIHHVMARSIKDIFCRYKTLKGYKVNRKAGWDTHGLPVELSVEKELGITKEDIGDKISVEEYNAACKKTVMRYTDVWNDLTEKMGYWVDMENPYITYESKYMESVWWLLGQLYEKNMIYKGYTIQPYSPKAGTGLSSHEINQPGCYQDVKDTTCVAQFKVVKNEDSAPLYASIEGEELNDVHLLAWTTTPWTLPSNTALTVGPKIEYVVVKSFNQYTFEPINVVVALPLLKKQFNKKFTQVESVEDLKSYKEGDKKIPYFVGKTFTGKELAGMRYEQLLPYALPLENPENAFQVILGDFVTTEDGTGIVHTAPTFGADDAMVAKQANVPGMLVADEHGNPVPLVDLQGKFRPEMGEFAGMYVKNEYYDEGQAPEKSVDVQIAIKLKEENKAFRVEKYEHSYPHCWRTDKPILYYPLDSWFVRVTDNKDRMMELNKTINWQPESTGTGRFGKWLENLNDWNLSRSRYWGIPIPIWRTDEGEESICISSIKQLKEECQKAVEAGVMDSNPLADFDVNDMSKENYDQVDLHKNYVDQITLVSASGKPMKREADLIDVWFDSGSMPYAQWHYPFENKELIDGNKAFPGDFIAEGVDQTRGWFYTLHAIATSVFDSVAYKNVISNGLVLDKNGQKMSKRLGNAVDPFVTLEKFGPDATRWYMVTNASPWDNLKFDTEGIKETQRKFFGTLYNTYSFFALYANIDGFSYDEERIATSERPEIDRWIISKLNSLIKDVDEAFETYEPTKAGRLIQNFVNDQLSNWYVRLCRRRFWKGEYSADKISAYQTLYECLEAVAIISAPIAPFYTDELFCDLNSISGRHTATSVHLADFPTVSEEDIDKELEAQMEIAQKVSSMALSLRKKERIRVRQPLQKIMVPILDPSFKSRIEHVKDLILSEINVKELVLLEDTTGVLTKKIKPNFKTIGPKYGKQMKAIAGMVNAWGDAEIAAVESNQGWSGEVNGEAIVLDMNDFEIVTDDIPGWLVTSEGGITVAMDITISPELKQEGIARELVNRIQNFRKEAEFEVTDKIVVSIETTEEISAAINENKAYIADEVLANEITIDEPKGKVYTADIEVEGDAKIGLEKVG
ncbi:isoleucine--tRNA ligase [Brumimicrobium aurantiacum]|uniref:Isoleucine--tRNA ligase n=1 Tax=Brumimicrobium aurantiacum TaxID=1737063 RepID=A0A3E1EXF3_9FLAO|nr:isoleucine--tRNA ligase [Brumimicrobium aurantiacum]RFC54217.1 isoleucine--tRNA ligase [Brumimicrobium aurantiacum]